MLIQQAIEHLFDATLAVYGLPTPLVDDSLDDICFVLNRVVTYQRTNRCPPPDAAQNVFRALSGVPNYSYSILRGML